MHLAPLLGVRCLVQDSVHPSHTHVCVYLLFLRYNRISNRPNASWASLPCQHARTPMGTHISCQDNPLRSSQPALLKTRLNLPYAPCPLTSLVRTPTLFGLSTPSRVQLWFGRNSLLMSQQRVALCGRSTRPHKFLCRAVVLSRPRQDLRTFPPHKEEDKSPAPRDGPHSCTFIWCTYLSVAPFLTVSRTR